MGETPPSSDSWYMIRHSIDLLSAITKKGIVEPAVLGCGSNLMNIVSSIKAIPKAGGVGYFADESKYEDFRIGGGITLNHLSWAQILNVPTGLLAIQGTDEFGTLLRQRMEEIGVSTKYIIVDDSYHTSVSHVFIDSNSNQHTYMFRGATSFISPEVVEKYFVPHLTNAKIVTSEISQVPLAGVRSLFEAAGKRKILRFLDMDLPSSVAVGPANLGSQADLEACLASCEVLKVNQGDVPELFPELDAQMLLQEPPSITAERISDRCLNAQVVAVTSGRKGAGLCMRGHEGINIQIIPDIKTADDTGAGDAFLGGLIAGLYHWGMPQTDEDVKRLGHLGSLAGAVCCQQFGTLPDAESVMKMTSIDDMNIVKDLFIVKDDAVVAEEKPKPELVENAIHDSLRRDKNNLKLLLDTYDESQFERAADMIVANENHGRKLFITGEGKSGTVGQRMAASLTSLGISSQFVPAIEWAHGDLGHLSEGDCVFLISHSGKNKDVMGLIDTFKKRGVVVVGMCGNKESPLITKTDAALYVPASEELLNCIPTRSVISQEAAINALMSQICALLKLNAEDFIRNHPSEDII